MCYSDCVYESVCCARFNTYRMFNYVIPYIVLNKRTTIAKKCLHTLVTTKRDRPKSNTISRMIATFEREKKKFKPKIANLNVYSLIFYIFQLWHTIFYTYLSLMYFHIFIYVIQYPQCIIIINIIKCYWMFCIMYIERYSSTGIFIVYTCV